MKTLCTKCRKVDDPDNYRDCAERTIMEREAVCFNCAFWMSLTESAYTALPTTAVVDGSVYHIAEEGVTGMSQGFCGRKFVIEFDDGRVVTTTNLWYRGKVPEAFAAEFPNNAVFCK